MALDDGSVWYLDITSDRVDDVPVIALEGRVSNATAAALADAIAAAARGAPRGVVIDFSEVDYVSSAGVRALEAGAAALHDDGRKLVVCGVREIIAPTFALAGSIAHLAVEPSRERAVARLRRQVL
jgi:anti-anti-sigma factor